MHQDAATTRQSLLDKPIGCREMLEQVLIFNVVDLHYHVLERAEELLVERQAQHRQHMCDVGLLKRLLAAQREQPMTARSTFGYSLR